MTSPEIPVLALDVATLLIPENKIPSTIARTSQLTTSGGASTWDQLSGKPQIVVLDPTGFLPWEVHQPGTVFRVYCPGNVQPARPTGRGDLHFQYWKATDVTYGNQFAIVGSDSWVPWDG